MKRDKKNRPENTEFWKILWEGALASPRRRTVPPTHWKRICPPLILNPYGYNFITYYKYYSFWYVVVHLRKCVSSRDQYDFLLSSLTILHFAELLQMLYPCGETETIIGAVLSFYNLLWVEM